MGTDSVTVRMYDVGFGDAFVVKVVTGSSTWRMLVDCGAHSAGQARPIRESVRAIIADLEADSPDGRAKLDVVVATHRHADHISGFSLRDWEEVVVDEVWVPFVEDDTDPDAAVLRKAHDRSARSLMALIEQRLHGLDPGEWPEKVAAARRFAVNSFGNADATDRLLGRNGQRFANTHSVRFLPATSEPDNVIALGRTGATARILGPSRDPEFLKQMEPPKSAGWLPISDPQDLPGNAPLTELFNSEYVVHDIGRLTHSLLTAQKDLRLAAVTNDAGLLSAASILERSVNNTSLFFVLELGQTRLLFPGDAQYGAWRHVLTDPAKRDLIGSATFYKIGHHGSHNATPKEFVETVWNDGACAMLPWREVKRWRDSIPDSALMSALHAHGHTVIRADAGDDVDMAEVARGGIWTEVSFAG